MNLRLVTKTLLRDPESAMFASASVGLVQRGRPGCPLTPSTTNAHHTVNHRVFEMGTTDAIDARFLGAGGEKTAPHKA